MENTAKNFALQLGSLVTLYVSIVALTMLLFGIITVRYPDVTQGYYEYENASSSIRFGIALLIVFFPAYLALTRMVNVVRRREHGIYLGLTKWLIYLSLIIGGATILGDLVAVVLGFLNGELTIRFGLKALSLLLVVGSGFFYYVLDAKGYWQDNEKKSIQYAVVVTLVVIASLATGFKNTETPAQVREMNTDAAQIQDLGVIQSQIESYYATKSSLPASLSDAFGTLTQTTAPEGRSAYTYEVVSDTSFKLCAEFAYESSKAEQMQYSQPFGIDGAYIKDGFNWTHGKGDWCFTRVLNTEITNIQKI